MNLLVFNCGSSSQGFTVFQSRGNEKPAKIAFGKARNVATKTKAASVLEWTIGNESGAVPGDYSTHRLAAEAIVRLLKEKGMHLDAAAHRFVNGGTFFRRAARITEESAAQMKSCFPLAPIHNPNSYSVIEVCMEQFPDLPEYAVFDTAFHSGMPEEAAVYAIPQDIANEKGLRKIGFHGLSYQYVSARAAELLGKPLSEVKLVMCHLGTGGSSVCAFRNGKTFDTSMGYSPLSGLIMSTRCGDIDPEAVLELVRSGMTPDEVSTLLNKRSGLVGLSQYSSNLGEIIEAAEQGNEACALTFKAYVLRLRKYIGAFLYEMNGADAIVFTDDAGVKYAKMREAVCSNADFLGIRLDAAANAAYDRKQESRISAAESSVQVWVIPTDEEQTIYDEVLKEIGPEGL